MCPLGLDSTALHFDWLWLFVVVSAVRSILICGCKDICTYMLKAVHISFRDISVLRTGYCLRFMAMLQTLMNCIRNSYLHASRNPHKARWGQGSKPQGSINVTWWVERAGSGCTVLRSSHCGLWVLMESRTLKGFCLSFINLTVERLKRALGS